MTAAFVGMPVVQLMVATEYVGMTEISVIFSGAGPALLELEVAAAAVVATVSSDDSDVPNPSSEETAK